MSFSIHEQGQEPIHGVKVHYYPPVGTVPAYYQCEEQKHGYWITLSYTEPCEHIRQIEDYRSRL